MPTRKTKEQFIEDARRIHGDRYDYSKVEYVNNKIPLVIICPIHGEFEQRGDCHLHGQGCPKCKPSQKSKLVFGVGINDCDGGVLGDEGFLLDSYRHWYNMLARCYAKSVLNRSPQYHGCSVCEEWLSYSNFKAWYDNNNVEDWALDKDIIFKGNKVYSPETCCFVPMAINSLFTNRRLGRGKYPIGVGCRRRGNTTRFVASLKKDGKDIWLGNYLTPEEAFNAYKVAKEAWIKEVADKWKDKLDPRVYKAMRDYKVEITD